MCSVQILPVSHQCQAGNDSNTWGFSEKGGVDWAPSQEEAREKFFAKGTDSTKIPTEGLRDASIYPYG